MGADSRSRSKILVAEDSPTQAQQLRYILEREGHDVAVAANGRIALEMARECRPALIISDVVMPEMDGYELSRAVKADPALGDTPVILVTTMSDPQDVIRGLECGADNFVIKPYETHYLLSRVRYVILNREMQRQNDAGIGVEIFFGGRRHYITADRLQILNLLLSTYDAAIQRNKELNRSQEELQELNARLNELTRELEERVRERTEELERSNDALRDSEERLRLTIDSALDAVIVVDVEGIVHDWNPQAESIFGWTREEAMGKLIHELIVPRQYLYAHVKGLQLAGITGEGPVLNQRIEVSAVTRDGSERPIELSLAPFTYHGRRLFSAFIRDITEKLESERRIRDLSHVNDLILAHAGEGIIAINRDGVLMFANPAAERLLGWEGEIEDVHLRLHPDEKDLRTCPLVAHLRGANSQSGRTTVMGAHGKRLEIRYTSSPIVDGGEVTGAVLTFADITERVKLERQLEQANRVASLGRVAATIAHEFNNVLMGIQPFAELIQQCGNDERVTKSAAQITMSVARGKRVAEEILRFTQPSEPALQTIALAEWVRHHISELQGIVGPRVMITPQVLRQPITINADPAQLQQVLTNLVINARDAIAGPGSITIAVDASETDAIITVSDTGGGMEQEVVEHIFDPLFTTKRTGTGLGLTVAQQVISRHGGTIAAASTPGEGTTFVIRIPLSTTAVEPVTQHAPRRRAAVRRILLVEDDPAITTGMSMLLEEQGFVVHAVERGGEAIPAIETFHPDVVVLDITLPDVDGRTVCREIGERYPELPVLFSSGHGDQSSLAPDFQSGRVGFLRKPYDLETLVAAFAEIAPDRR